MSSTTGPGGPRREPPCNLARLRRIELHIGRLESQPVDPDWLQEMMRDLKRPQWRTVLTTDRAQRRLDQAIANISGQINYAMKLATIRSKWTIALGVIDDTCSAEIQILEALGEVASEMFDTNLQWQSRIVSDLNLSGPTYFLDMLKDRLSSWWPHLVMMMQDNGERACDGMETFLYLKELLEWVELQHSWLRLSMNIPTGYNEWLVAYVEDPGVEDFRGAPWEEIAPRMAAAWRDQVRLEAAICLRIARTDMERGTQRAQVVLAYVLACIRDARNYQQPEMLTIDDILGLISPDLTVLASSELEPTATDPATTPAFTEDD